MVQKYFCATLFVALSTLAGITSFAEDVKVPDAVKSAFAEKYKHAKDVKWGTEKEDGKTAYEAAWKDNDGMKQEVLFDEKGGTTLVAQEVKIDQIPKAVTDAVSKSYPGSKVQSAMLEVGKTTVYEVSIKDAADKKITLDVTPDGSKVTVDAD
jgi:uncharacterized membrane protein YkoI